jgi:hypothetical protein
MTEGYFHVIALPVSTCAGGASRVMRQAKYWMFHW